VGESRLSLSLDPISQIQGGLWLGAAEYRSSYV
jgi:hypothetical protein